MDEISYTMLYVWNDQTGEWFEIDEYRSYTDAVEDAKRRELPRYKIMEIREVVHYCDGNL